MKKMNREKPEISSETYEAFKDSLTSSLKEVGIDIKKQLEVNRHLHTVDAQVVGIRISRIDSPDSQARFNQHDAVRGILTQKEGHGKLYFSHIDQGMYVYTPKKQQRASQFPEDWFHIDPKEPPTR